MVSTIILYDHNLQREQVNGPVGSLTLIILSKPVIILGVAQFYFQQPLHQLVLETSTSSSHWVFNQIQRIIQMEHWFGLYNYLAKGIIDSGILEDGGQGCYDQIPKHRHLLYALVGLLLHLYIFKKFYHTLDDPARASRETLQSNWIEKLVALGSFISLALTAYLKLMTGKGIFMFNPCHISISVVIILCLVPSTPAMRRLHTMWTTWIFGALLALLVPHLYGISEFEVVVYYVEHLFIVPIGLVVLYRRYGFLPPTIKNQFAAFSTMVIYQMGVLFPLSLATKANLNFALCHSPGDPFFHYFKGQYFLAGAFYLNLSSFVIRLLCFAITTPLKAIWRETETGDKTISEDDIFDVSK